MAGKKKQQTKLKEKIKKAQKAYRAYKKSNPNGGKKWTSFVKEQWK